MKQEQIAATLSLLRDPGNLFSRLLGLGPNLVGVAPSRAVYFLTYSQTKLFFNGVLPSETPVVHICSASCAGFMACTLTNPIWFVKTRLQLDLNKDNRMSVSQCIKRIYRQSVSV